MFKTSLSFAFGIILSANSLFAGECGRGKVEEISVGKWKELPEGLAVRLDDGKWYTINENVDLVQPGVVERDNTGRAGGIAGGYYNLGQSRLKLLYKAFEKGYTVLLWNHINNEGKGCPSDRFGAHFDSVSLTK